MKKFEIRWDSKHRYGVVRATIIGEEGAYTVKINEWGGGNVPIGKIEIVQGDTMMKIKSRILSFARVTGGSIAWSEDEEELKVVERSQEQQYQTKYDEVIGQVRELERLLERLLERHKDRLNRFGGGSWALVGDLNRTSGYINEAMQSLK